MHQRSVQKHDLQHFFEVTENYPFSVIAYNSSLEDDWLYRSGEKFWKKNLSGLVVHRMFILVVCRLVDVVHIWGILIDSYISFKWPTTGIC